MARKKTSQSGFTLVELSVVLVIIGLIVGGVLGGRQIIQKAQITNVVSAIEAYQSQFQAYIQNYNAMPGDDSKAVSRFQTSTGAYAVVDGSGNGSLTGAFDDTDDAQETRLIWGHLRAAGLVKGAAGDPQQPSNPFGGIYGFQYGAFTGSALFSTNVICLNGVSGDAAAMIDAKLDDGSSNSGSVMAGASVAGEVAAAYVPTAAYVICVRM